MNMHATILVIKHRDNRKLSIVNYIFLLKDMPFSCG